MNDARAIAHQIATRAAHKIVTDGIAAGLAWSDIVVSCESTIAIVIAAAIEMEGRSDGVQFATELMDMLTERAHRRVLAYVRGVPFDG